MSRFTLHTTLTGSPIEAEDLRTLLERASNTSPEILDRVDKDGQLYLDSVTVRESIRRIETHQAQGHSFSDAVEKVVLQIESSFD